MWAWRRDRVDASGPAPAEWPPLSTTTSTLAAAAAAAEGSTEPASTTGTSSGTSAASVVNALVDAPEARSADRSTGGWADPLDDGTCPISHPVKANDNSGIFHLPGGRFYDRTKPERCYSDADAAVADGYRQAKN